MNKRLIIITLAALLIGFAVGVITMQIATRKRIRSIVEMQRPPRFKKELKEELNLNERQSVQYDSIFREHIVKVRKLRAKERSMLKGEMNELFSSIETTLNKDQVEKLKAFESKMRRHHEKKMKKDREYHRP